MIGSENSEPQPRRRASRTASRLASLAVFGAAALGVIQFYEPPRQFIESRGEATGTWPGEIHGDDVSRDTQVDPSTPSTRELHHPTETV